MLDHLQALGGDAGVYAQQKFLGWTSLGNASDNLREFCVNQ